MDDELAEDAECNLEEHIIMHDLLYENEDLMQSEIPSILIIY